METLAKDLCYALRSLRNSPGFTVIAVLTLALGIGANTAIFSVVQTLLFQRLPYPQVENLIRWSCHWSFRLLCGHQTSCQFIVWSESR
jgi:hypothetical protein